MKNLEALDPRTAGARPSGATENDSGPEDQPEVLDPNDSNVLRDRIRGRTEEHAQPPRLEDEGQSGG
ncbi:MAG TPA: hypothetical protein VGL72_11595 [Bryobacteraceae bacterium]